MHGSPSLQWTTIALLHFCFELGSRLFGLEQGVAVACNSPVLPLPVIENTQSSMLHREGTLKKNAHVVWDEENLKENAEIQKEYSQIRIQEPKTPYHAPLPVDDEDMKPLELDQEGAATSKVAVMTAFDFVMSNGGAEYTPPGPSRRRMASSTSGTSADDELADGGVSNKRSEPCNSFTSSGSEGAGCGTDPGSADKKRRFEAMRKQHYNMRQALVKAKQLLASEDEEDEEADTANWRRSHEQSQEPADQGDAGPAAGASGQDEQPGPSSSAGMVDANGKQQQQEQQEQQEQQQQHLKTDAVQDADMSV